MLPQDGEYHQLLPPAAGQHHQLLPPAADQHHQLLPPAAGQHHQLLPPSAGQMDYPAYSHVHNNHPHHQLSQYMSPEVEYKPLQQQQQPQQQQQSEQPTVEHYRSQFIKEGLKLKVQQKLKEEPIRDSLDEDFDIKSELEVGPLSGTAYTRTLTSSQN